MFYAVLMLTKNDIIYTNCSDFGAHSGGCDKYGPL